MSPSEPRAGGTGSVADLLHPEVFGVHPEETIRRTIGGGLLHHTDRRGHYHIKTPLRNAAAETVEQASALHTADRIPPQLAPGRY